MAPSVKELTGIIEEDVYAMAITALFKGNTIDLFDIGISTPEDTSLAIGCINEVAFVHTASRFGTTGVLQRHHHFPVRF